MSSEKRKAVLVLTNGIQGYGPPIEGVTLFALCSHLTTMNVGVTISAFIPHVGEYQADVALRARDVLMHPPQWIASFIVIEFGNVANRSPTQSSVTVLALYVQRTVRTSRGFALTS